MILCVICMIYAKVGKEISIHLLNLVDKEHLGTKEEGLDHIWVWNILKQMQLILL